jgi:hypothetical protein
VVSLGVWQKCQIVARLDEGDSLALGLLLGKTCGGGVWVA